VSNNIKTIDPSQIRYTPVEGEMIKTPEGKYLTWSNGEWHEIKVEGGGLEMGLYDLNKQIITQLPELTDFEESAQLINSLHTDWNNGYYMLYGKEISYFTVFKVIDPSVFADVVIECICNIGPVKAIDLTENADAIEVWVMYNNEPTCLYLFPYDMGLVWVGE
jgi:hypothetical protein